jgi:hypothetical protein
VSVLRGGGRFLSVFVFSCKLSSTAPCLIGACGALPCHGAGHGASARTRSDPRGVDAVSVGNLRGRRSGPGGHERGGAPSTRPRKSDLQMRGERNRSLVRAAGASARLFVVTVRTVRAVLGVRGAAGSRCRAEKAPHDVFSSIAIRTAPREPCLPSAPSADAVCWLVALRFTPARPRTRHPSPGSIAQMRAAQAPKAQTPLEEDGVSERELRKVTRPCVCRLRVAAMAGACTCAVSWRPLPLAGRSGPSVGAGPC